jgi:hypothetical protein
VPEFVARRIACVMAIQWMFKSPHRLLHRLFQTRISERKCIAQQFGNTMLRPGTRSFRREGSK